MARRSWLNPAECARMRNGLTITTGLFGLGVVLALIQFVFCPWTSEIFFRLEILLLGPLLLLLAIRFLVREHEEDQTTRRGEKLDE